VDPREKERSAPRIGETYEHEAQEEKGVSTEGGKEKKR